MMATIDSQVLRAMSAISSWAECSNTNDCAIDRLTTPLNDTTNTHSWMQLFFVRHILQLGALRYILIVFFLWRYERMCLVAEKYGILQNPAITRSWMQLFFVRRISQLGILCYLVQVFFLWRYKRMRLIAGKYGIPYVESRNYRITYAET